MRVTVVDRRAMDATWGSGPSRVVLRTVEISDTCPRCGRPRGEVRWERYCEDGEWYSVNRWQNPCGHSDSYASVLREAS